MPGWMPAQDTPENTMQNGQNAILLTIRNGKLCNLTEKAAEITAGRARSGTKSRPHFVQNVKPDSEGGRMATIEKCSVCGASAAVRWKPGTGRARFLVWVECTECGTHTRQYMDSGQPEEDSPGGKWAILAWTSGEQNTQERR